MPLGSQSITAFGAAANLVHPATGYSIARMLHETAPLATTIADTLSRNSKVGECAHDVWTQLWPQEKRTQVRDHRCSSFLLSFMLAVCEWLNSVLFVLWLGAATSSFSVSGPEGGDRPHLSGLSFELGFERDDRFAC